MTVFYEAAAVCDRLVGAGLPSDAVHWWWARPRGDLGGVSPRLYAVSAPGGAGRRVLELAERDVAALRAEEGAARTPALVGVRAASEATAVPGGMKGEAPR